MHILGRRLLRGTTLLTGWLRAAGREGQHGDLVLAVALAAWWRERNHARIEQAHARHYGQAEETGGPGRLLSNGLRTIG